MPSIPNQLNHQYLQPQDLKALRHLVFSPRHAIEGQYAGRHSSPQRGHAVEFNDYRQYQPGDEIGDIDWKIYGRSDKLVVKLFQHQTDMTVNLLVDASASMGYSSESATQGKALKEIGSYFKSGGGEAQKNGRIPEKALSKFDLACQLAASISFLITQQQDRVGLGLAAEGLKDYHPPGSSFRHLHRLMMSLDGVVPKGEARLIDSLEHMFRASPRRSVLIVFSDLLEDRDEIIKSLTKFIHRGTEVILFHVLHADELHLPEQLDTAVFTDSESGERIAVNVNDIRKQYELRMSEFLRGWSHETRIRNIDYNLVNTQTGYRKALEKYLFTRASRS